MEGIRAKSKKRYEKPMTQSCHCMAITIP
jgi:hypothetical protein